MTLTNVGWLLAGWVASSVVLAGAWSWLRRDARRLRDNDRDHGEAMVRVSDLPEIRRGLREDIERARRDNRGEPA
jgi:hypothetical protein